MSSQPYDTEPEAGRADGGDGLGALSDAFAGLTPKEEAILRQRAHALAHQGLEESTPVSETAEVLTFHLGQEAYAIDVRFVHEARPLEQLTPVPCAPDFVAGVVNLHGDILSLLDLRKYLGVQQEGITDLMQIIVVEAAGLKLGILANRVDTVTWLPREDFEEPPATLAGAKAGYVRGVSAEGLILLDLEAILGDGRIIVNEEAV